MKRIILCSIRLTNLKNFPKEGGGPGTGAVPKRATGQRTGVEVGVLWTCVGRTVHVQNPPAASLLLLLLLLSIILGGGGGTGLSRSDAARRRRR